MAQVEIAYGSASGVLDRVEDLQHAVLLTYGTDVDAVTLRPTDAERITVAVDGATVYESDADRFDHDAGLRGIDARL
jgi:selenoprotein W-related protein